MASVLRGLGVVLALGVPVALAEAPSLKGFGEFKLVNAQDPIEVKSDRLEFDYDGRRAVFKGVVEAVQGDVHLFCDTLTVGYSDDGKAQEIEEVLADGNVRIVQGDRRATSKAAAFDQRKRTLVLEGDATLHDGENLVTGETITVYPDQSKFVIDSGERKRVKVELFPKNPPAGARSETPVAPSNGSPAKAATPTKLRPDANRSSLSEVDGRR